MTFSLFLSDQADYIMVVGMGDDPSVGEYEKLLLATKTTARKELVLLHPDRSVPSGSTRPWLKASIHSYLRFGDKRVWLV